MRRLSKVEMLECIASVVTLNEMFTTVTNETDQFISVDHNSNCFVFNSKLVIFLWTDISISSANASETKNVKTFFFTLNITFCPKQINRRLLQF